MKNDLDLIFCAISYLDLNFCVSEQELGDSLRFLGACYQEWLISAI